MKTFRSVLLLLAAAGVALAPPPPSAHAQVALRVDTDGNPTTTLKLSGGNVTGTLSPGRLGTGTPSSGTVLRGDGAWVGTTATGNTIAAAGNLLMGDGAGNALGVASGADLFRVWQAQANTQGVTLPKPPNLLLASTLNLHASAQNADGTLTIAPNSYVEWNNDPTNATVAPRYGYVVAVGDVPANALTVAGYYGGFQAVDEGNVQTHPAPGVFTGTFTNRVAAGGYGFFVANNTPSPVTVYYPLLTLRDPGHPIFASYAERTVVPSQPVADLDFTRFESADRSGRYAAEKMTTLAADSVNGGSANAGTLYAPKLTLQQTVANGAVFGLYRGSLFRESLPLSTPGTTHGINVQDVAFGQAKALPIVSALDPVNTGGFIAMGDGTYSADWLSESGVANDGYSNVYVVEINTATEAASPVASRRRMVDVTSAAAAVSTPGSVYVLPFGPNHWLAQLHPSDGLAPGSGTYRYEVVSRYCPANWGASANTGDGAMSGMELVGSSSGYGGLAGPPGFVGDRLALLHCTTHSAVIGGGSLQRSVFYESGDPTAIQLAWYTPNGAGLRWNLNRCLFYANVGDRPANGLISHTAGASYDRGDIRDTAFLGARWSDGSLHGTAIDYVNVATGVIERVYVQGVLSPFGLTMPATAEARNNVFRQVGLTNLGEYFHDNIVLAESMSDPTYAGHRGPTACFVQNSGANIVNNLLWARGLATGLQSDDAAQGIKFYNNNLDHVAIQRNIIIVNPAGSAGGSYLNTQGTAAGATLAIDYNLVISTSKSGLPSGIGPAPGRSSWADYVSYEAGAQGYDQHSLYVDLSTDPRGLQAVFMDPLNGDFRWAQTDVAQQCADYCQANHVGPAAVTSHWPLVPTVDDAVRMLTDL